MNMNLVYPATVEVDTDGCTVTFRDLPGAISCGDTPLEALEQARDALALVIEDMLEEGETVPAPSKPAKGEYFVAVPPDVGARVLLAHIRNEQGLTKAAAAGRAGVSRQLYGQLESRGRNLTLKKLAAITDKLGYDVVMEVRPRERVINEETESGTRRKGSLVRDSRSGRVMAPAAKKTAGKKRGGASGEAATKTNVRKKTRTRRDSVRR